MHRYRQVLARRRAKDTAHQMARGGLMGRDKATPLREVGGSGLAEFPGPVARRGNRCPGVGWQTALRKHRKSFHVLRM